MYSYAIIVCYTMVNLQKFRKVYYHGDNWRSEVQDITIINKDEVCSLSGSVPNHVAQGCKFECSITIVLCSFLS